MDNQTETIDLGDRVTALENSVAAFGTSLAAINDKFAALPAGVTQDDINNATHPLADDIANLRDAVSGINSAVNDILSRPDAAAVASALTIDGDTRNAWVDAVLHKFFPGEKPAPVADDAGRTG